MKPDFSQNIVLVGEYQKYERRRWASILSVGPSFLTKDVIEAGGSFIRDAYDRLEPISPESLRIRDSSREIVRRAAVAASSISAAAGREISVCEHHLRTTLSQLVAINEGLVKKMSSRFALSAQTIDVKEIEQEGFFGIKHAAERFDISLGNEFSTYAVWWIRAVMKRYVCNHSTDVRVPIHRHDRDRALRKKIDSITSSKNGQVSVTDIADMLRENPEDICDALTAQSSRFVSLDASRPTHGADSSKSFGSDSFRLPDTEAVVEDEETADEQREMVRDLLRYSELPSRSMRLIELRYGIGSVDSDPMTLEEAGKVLGLTKERVRQIEKETLAELRDAAAELKLPYSTSSSSMVHPNRKFGAPDVLSYLTDRPGVWLSVEDIQSGIRWMSSGSIAACLRWIASKGESNVYRDGKRWCYSTSPIAASREDSKASSDKPKQRVMASRTARHSTRGSSR